MNKTSSDDISSFNRPAQNPDSVVPNWMNTHENFNNPSSDVK